MLFLFVQQFSNIFLNSDSRPGFRFIFGSVYISSNTDSLNEFEFIAGFSKSLEEYLSLSFIKFSIKEFSKDLVSKLCSHIFLINELFNKSNELKPH